MEGRTRALPGELPCRVPSKAASRRLLGFHPYVREAQDSVREAWHLLPRKLFDYLLVRQVAGSSRVTVDGACHDLHPGELVWVPPDTLHEMRSTTDRTRYQYLHFDLIYDPERSNWTATVPGGTTDLTPWASRIHPPISDPVVGTWCGKLTGGSPSHVGELMQRIIIEYDRTQISNLLVAGLMLQLVGHLLGGTERGSKLASRHTHTIENAMQHIQRNCQGKLHIDTLAHQHGLSPTHFRKLFREHYHQSPREAHLNAKTRTACDYLIYSDLSISQIADRLSFTNVHNFSRAFRHAIGQPPSSYRSNPTAD